MENLYIKATKSSPEVNFDVEKNKLALTGQSYPENAFEFYEKVFDWIEEYLEEKIEDEIKLEICLHYLNTSSSKCLMNILDMFQEAFEEGKKVSLVWYYDELNEHIVEVAEEFCEDLEFENKILSYSS